MASQAAVEVVANTLREIAMGGTLLDQLAVLAVVRERVKRPGAWGRSWAEVCEDGSLYPG